MIAEIGLMVGCYIIVRMLSLLGDPDEHWTVKLSACGAILVSILCLADLLLRGLYTTPSLTAGLK